MAIFLVRWGGDGWEILRNGWDSSNGGWWFLNGGSWCPLIDYETSLFALSFSLETVISTKLSDFSRPSYHSQNNCSTVLVSYTHTGLITLSFSCVFYLKTYKIMKRFFIKTIFIKNKQILLQFMPTSSQIVVNCLG